MDPLQIGVACSSGAEKVLHELRNCFALTRAKLSLPKISLLTSDLGRPCLVDKRVASLDNA